MKFEPLGMEDWLAKYQRARFNLAESSYVDTTVGELFDECGEDVRALRSVSLINPDTFGSEELRREIGRCYQSVEASEILVTVGLSEALFIFMNLCLEPGDEVVLATPAFQPLHEVPRAIGCRVRSVSLERSAGYRFDVGAFERAFSPATRLLIVNSPHNPTGAMLPEADMRRLAQATHERGISLLFDEHYRFLPLEGDRELLASGFDVCRSINPNTAALGSITKCFGVNGLRVGWLVGSRATIERARAFKDYLTHVTPPVSDAMATMVLRHRQRLGARIRAELGENLGRLEAFMDRHADSLRFVRPRGGLVCFPTLLGEQRPGAFFAGLVEKQGVSVLPGASFGAEYESSFRLNIGQKPGVFAHALDGFARALGERRAPGGK